MIGCKYKTFDSEGEALVFQYVIAEVINGGKGGDTYQSKPLYDADINKYAIRLVSNFREEIISVIGQEEWDNSPQFVLNGDFAKMESKER